jgi:inorganic pyrophosphatase
MGEEELAGKSEPNPWDRIDPREGCEENCFQAVIEIPLGDLNKYEVDKKSGFLRLDRVLHSAVHYPANYGFIPQTRAEDGDALDVLVFSSAPVHPLTILKARPIGLMKMKDQKQTDHKIIAVALGDPDYSNYRDVSELPPHRLDVLKQFFKDYKVLEKKRVVVQDLCPASAAGPVIEAALERFRTNLAPI